MKRKNIGSSFDSWLREEGLFEEISAKVLARVLARRTRKATRGKRPKATRLT
jgi:hypothetical protein